MRMGPRSKSATAWRWRRNISRTVPTSPAFPRPCCGRVRPSAPPPSFVFPDSDGFYPRALIALPSAQWQGEMLRTFVTLIAAVMLAVPARAQDHWVGSWATSQQSPEERNALGPHDLDDATLRQTVHLSIAGARLRLHMSNAFGSAPLHIAAAHIARGQPGRDGIEAASDTALPFSCQADVTMPAGADYVSVPVALTGKEIAISIYLYR